jgi:hypothetical protein
MTPRYDVHTRALLVSLNISCWAAKKYDAKISKEVADKHATSEDAGRYNKSLLLKGQTTHAELNSFLANVRQEHYKNTLAWSDDGWRLLPVANYMEYASMVRKATAEYEVKLEAFIADYPAMKETAMRTRNGLLSEDEFPTISQLRRKYALAADFKPMPRGEDFRVTLGQAEIDQLAKSCEDKVTSALKEAQADAVQRLYTCIQKMHEKLSDPDAIFRDTLVTNARELCDVLTRLNIGEDSHLEDIRQSLERLALNNEPETLRKDDRARAQVADETAALMSAMRGLYPEVQQ